MQYNLVVKITICIVQITIEIVIFTIGMCTLHTISFFLCTGYN